MEFESNILKVFFELSDQIKFLYDQNEQLSSAVFPNNNNDRQSSNPTHENNNHHKY